MIGHDDQQRLRSYLLPGERLLWTGRPQLGIAFQPRDIWLLPLAAATAAAHLPPIRFVETGSLNMVTIFVAATLLWVGGARFLYEPWTRRNLLYAVTDRRAIILGGRLRPRLLSHDLAWLPMLILKQESRDRATLLIEEGESPDGWLALARERAGEAAKGFRFFRIEKPTFVYDLICRASRDRRADLNRTSSNPLIG